MKKILFGFWLLSLLALVGCQKNNPESCPVNGTGYSCNNETVDMSLDLVESGILNALKNKDVEALITFVSEDWVRFSPYSYVNTGMDITLSKSELTWLRNSGTVKEWWNYDGSGEPILLTMSGYLEKFVYDVDFLTAPEKFVNDKKERWNTINNAFEIYSGATLVEYYFSGFDLQYEWMDWRSLMLVLKKYWTEWKLIWIIHGQRTI